MSCPGTELQKPTACAGERVTQAALLPDLGSAANIDVFYAVHAVSRRGGRYSRRSDLRSTARTTLSTIMAAIGAITAMAMKKPRGRWTPGATAGLSSSELGDCSEFPPSLHPAE